MGLKDDAAEKLQTINNVLFYIAMIAVVILCLIDVANAKTVSAYGFETKWSFSVALISLITWTLIGLGLWVEKLIVDCLCNVANHAFQIKIMLTEGLYNSPKENKNTIVSDGKSNFWGKNTVVNKTSANVGCWKCPDCGYSDNKNEAKVCWKCGYRKIEE